MKVLYITNVPSPYRVDFFNELSDYCDLTVFYEKDVASNRDTKWENKDSRKFKQIFSRGIFNKDESALCFNILPILLKRWDKIVVGGYATPTGILAILILKIKRAKFYINADGGFIANEKLLKYRLKRYLIGSATYWLCTGKRTKEYLVHYGARSENIFEYPFSSLKLCEVEKVSQDKKERLRIQLDITNNIMVLSVGQFIQRKGFEDLLKACSLLAENISVYIIGGSPTDTYKNIVKKYNLENVHFIGFKTKTELIDFYHCADIFVLPTREDIWGLVVNEAMSHGLPTITTDKCIAGLTMISEGQNGFIIPIKDEQILADKINLLAKDRNLRTVMGERAMQTAGIYTIENMARIHYKIFLNN
ncbi:glycosyltransferase family 4 protein [Clostridium aminobutyricum]|uniref:Glycosyltransferase family 4 protein n=1 Tax=Clostridium aminobutyricum TaxID=33953 RepID=A0A939IJY5_CLOAM|nr:glycosyltransferase family 4 protein [Clostridium aminobutyricum]MBN7774073.1 glycosyltransferase family 4 protein [Clostridium aminobutyricum]